MALFGMDQKLSQHIMSLLANPTMVSFGIIRVTTTAPSAAVAIRVFTVDA